MKFREQPEQATDWIETAIPATLSGFGMRPAVDEARVTAAMLPGWRYQEPPLGEQIPDEDYIGALQTSAWFTIPYELIYGAMGGSMPEHDALPPLPFPRVAFDALNEDGGMHPFVAIEYDDNTAIVNAATVVVFEVEQGKLWDVLAHVVIIDADNKERTKTTLMGYHFTPGGFTADYEGMTLGAIATGQDPRMVDALKEFDAQFSTYLWSACVTAAHLVTARGVVNRRLYPHRKQRREMQRQRFQPAEPRIYRVDLIATEPTEGGTSSREYHCRWMVTGHYRHWPTGKHTHPDTGLPAVWIPAYVKGPAGAPWKGRPQHFVAEPAR